MTFIAVVFLVVLGIVYGAYWMFVLLPEDDVRRRLHRRLKGGSDKTRARRHSVLKKETEDTVKLEVLEAVLNRAGGKLQPLRRLVDQSGVRVTISALVLTSGCLLLFTLLLVFSLTARPLAGLVAGVVAASLPFMYLHRVRTKRLRKFEEGFPDAIDLIARSLRAGHAFSTGLSMVAEEVDAPVGTEFKTIYEQQNYGIPMSDALKGLAQRVSLVDVRFFVTAVLTQREAGGQPRRGVEQPRNRHSRAVQGQAPSARSLGPRPDEWVDPGRPATGPRLRVHACRPDAPRVTLQRPAWRADGGCGSRPASPGNARHSANCQYRVLKVRPCHSSYC